MAQTRFDISFRKGFFFSFFVGFFIRMLPEILSYPHPIGFDTVYYAARINSSVVWYNWTSLFSTWLLCAFLILIHLSLRLNPFILLKLVGPTLYGLNVCGIYYFARKALKWNVKMSIVAASVFAFQLAALRVSWDLLRNTLGMAILLFSIPSIRTLETKKEFGLFMLLSVLVVFSHLLVSIVLLVIVLVVVFSNLLKGKKKTSLKVLGAFSPALTMLSAGIYLTFSQAPFSFETNIISVYQPLEHPYGLFFLANYLNPVQYSTYPELVSHVLSLFAVLYLLYMPLVFNGFFRDQTLDVWTVFLLVTSLSCLVIPFCAFDFWHRWMFMLAYPLTFYVTSGFYRALGQRESGRSGWKWLEWVKISKKTAFGILFSTALLTSLYISTTIQSDSYLIFSIPTISRYFSVSPTVPLRDVEDTVQVMEWLNGNMENESCLLAHKAFLSWARLYLENKQVIVYFESDVERALVVAAEAGFDPIYFVWWGENIGWYGVSVPSHFSLIFESGRIAVYER